MAEFIVISASGRLHRIVDGIRECHPRCDAVRTGISTGKIIRSEDGGYLYEYQVYDKPEEADESRPLRERVANHVAAFRLAYAIPQDETVNIFFLENPLNQDELDESDGWIEEFNELYNGGKGHIVNFRLYRIVFTYNPDSPADIMRHIPVPILRELLDNHRKTVSDTARGGENLWRYLFYISNQKADEAATSLGRDDHDLKLPRFLTDFMMLVSDSDNAGYIHNAIHPAGCNTGCFSAGFAESMYYYPDVERYFKLADNRDLHLAFLSDEDETAGLDDKKAMDTEAHPFGLRTRKKRLGEIYESVPFSEDIQSHPCSADKKIDDEITGLKTLIERGRREEWEAVKTSLGGPEGDDVSEEQLKNAEREFDGTHPRYIDRAAVYLANDDKERDGKEAQYEALVSYVTSEAFLDYVKRNPPESDPRVDPDPPAGGDNSFIDKTKKESAGKRNFLHRMWNWIRDIFKRKEEQKDPAEIERPVVDSPVPSSGQEPADSIMRIKKRTELKKAFADFKRQVECIEQEYEKKRTSCDGFKLTDHTSHCFPLIDLRKLKEEQSSGSKARRDEAVKEWKKEAAPTRASLIRLVEKKSSEYTSGHYLYINWAAPFSFVRDPENAGSLPAICNELQKRAAPFVNFSLYEESMNERVVRMMYSDHPRFKGDFSGIKERLDNGGEVSAYWSKHIESKICFMQILPMDDDVLDNLADLQEEDSEYGTRL